MFRTITPRKRSAHRSATIAFIVHGSPNVEGAAHGTVLFFFLSALYLIPAILLHIVNPFLIHSPFDAVFEQGKLFMLLRVETLLYGVAAIIVFGKILKDHFNNEKVFKKAPLSPEVVAHIYKTTLPIKEACEIFGIGRGTYYDIKKGKRWKGIINSLK